MTGEAPLAKAEASPASSPRMGMGDVSSQMMDFAITTYDVDPAALKAKLPEGIEPTVGPMKDGRERAFVSAVTFLNTSFYVAFAPFVRLTCAQTNYRAYVSRNGERGAYFFATHLDSIFVHMPRTFWRLPWERSHVVQSAEWAPEGAGAGCRSYAWDGRGTHEERLRARGTGAPIGVLDGFEDEATSRLVMTHPEIGWLTRRDGKLATYSVWHAPLELERCEIDEARFERWEALGLVEPGQRPCSVLVQQHTHYLVRLPPKLVRPSTTGRRASTTGRPENDDGGRAGFDSPPASPRYGALALAAGLATRW